MRGSGYISGMTQVLPSAHGLDSLSTHVLVTASRQELREILQLANGLRRKVEAVLDRQ